MKTIISLLVVICVCVLSCYVYGGWTGHGLVVIKTWFSAIVLMVAALLAIIIFCFYQFAHKKRDAWRRCFLQAAILTVGWAVTFIIATAGSGVAVKTARYCYWKSHKSELEFTALNQLKRQRFDGYYSVPKNEVSQFDYPIFVYMDSSNKLQVVGFSHYSTAPGRRSGFIFLKEPNNAAVNALHTHTEVLIQLSTNWFEYVQYKTTIP